MFPPKKQGSGWVKESRWIKKEEKGVIKKEDDLSESGRLVFPFRL